MFLFVLSFRPPGRVSFVWVRWSPDRGWVWSPGCGLSHQPLCSAKEDDEVCGLLHEQQTETLLGKSSSWLFIAICCPFAHNALPARPTNISVSDFWKAGNHKNAKPGHFKATAWFNNSLVNDLNVKTTFFDFPSVRVTNYKWRTIYITLTSIIIWILN